MESKKTSHVCPICFRVISPTEQADTWTCKTCSLVYHMDCGWEGTGLTYGGKVRPKNLADRECSRCTEKKELDKLKEEFELPETVVGEMKNELDNLKQECKKRDRQVTPGKWIYVPVLCLVVVFISFLVWRGWAEKPEVSIQFNVGEIIGGVLIGLSAILAAITYHTTKRREERRINPN